VEPHRVVRALEAVASQPDGPLPDRICAGAAGLLDAPGVGISLAADDQPSYTTHLSGWPVLVDDLARDATWPAFGPAATEQGFGSIFAFPLRSGSIRSGALTLYRGWSGDLSDDQFADALVFARLALDLVLHLQAGSTYDGVDGVGRPGLLDGLLTTRMPSTLEVHQAAGIVSVQLGSTVGEALAVLRARAYTAGRPLHAVAADVVARRLRFSQGDHDAT
jgi:hypothetical protein